MGRVCREESIGGTAALRSEIPLVLRPAVVEVEPEYDEVTRYGFAFRVRRYVAPYLKQKFTNVIQLLKNGANRARFRQACSDMRVTFLTGLGHGNATTYTGQNDEVLWQVSSYNPSEAAGKKIHLLSCSTAKQLGSDLVRNKAIVYFGYSESFVFVMSRQRYDDPLRDDRADAFFKCDSEIDRQIADGSPPSNVYQAAYNLYTAKIDEWAEKDSEVASWLLHNRDALTKLQ